MQIQDFMLRSRIKCIPKYLEELSFSFKAFTLKIYITKDIGLLACDTM